VWEERIKERVEEMPDVLAIGETIPGIAPLASGARREARNALVAAGRREEDEFLQVQ